MSYTGFGGRRAAPRRRRGSVMTRIAVGLSPLWLGALFLTIENTSGRADKPSSAGVATAAVEKVAMAPAAERSPAVAAVTTETSSTPAPTPAPTPAQTVDATLGGPTADLDRVDGDELPGDESDGDRLAQRTPEKLDALPQTGWDEPVAATVPQPTWMPKPRPQHLAQPSPDEESTDEFPAASAVSSVPEVDPADRRKYPPEPAADLGGREAPAERLGAWEDPLAAPASSPLTDARVVIHRPRSGASSGAGDLLSVLRTRGVGVSEIRNVGASVSQPDIRFFHERDRAVAEQVNRLLSRQGYRPAVKDFTHYRQPPSRGTVEVWLPG